MMNEHLIHDKNKRGWNVLPPLPFFPIIRKADQKAFSLPVDPLFFSVYLLREESLEITPKNFKQYKAHRPTTT